MKRPHSVGQVNEEWAEKQEVSTVRNSEAHTEQTQRGQPSLEKGRAGFKLLSRSFQEPGHPHWATETRELSRGRRDVQLFRDVTALLEDPSSIPSNQARQLTTTCGSMESHTLSCFCWDVCVCMCAHTQMKTFKDVSRDKAQS